MHGGQLALVWRLYRVVFVYSKREWYELSGLRLVHVSFQTIPYAILYGRLLVVDAVTHLQPLPVVSLVISLVSGTVALCTCTLRRRLHEALVKDSLPSQPSKPRRYVGLFLLLSGSTLCLTSRLGAFALMSAQHTYWTLLPFGVHFSVLLVLHFGCFRMRSEKSKSPIWRQVVARLAKAYLGTFELMDDNFQRVQCRYVGYYSVMLVENLVMTALWMLFSPMDYVVRLLVAVGFLAMFLCALVVKFASCGLIIARISGGTAPDPNDFSSIGDMTRTTDAVTGSAINGRYGSVHTGSRHGPSGRVSSTSGSKQSVSVATISSHSRDVVCSDHSHQHLHHHHYHRHEQHQRHRNHSCAQCEGRGKANSHATSTVLTDSATVNTSLGRTSSQQRRNLLSRSPATSEGKASHRHRHTQRNILVTEDNQHHLKELIIDQLSREYAARDRHEHDACSFDDPVLASRLVMESLRGHRHHRHYHHHHSCPHSRRAHSEGSKHRLETCHEEDMHLNRIVAGGQPFSTDRLNVRWKTAGFLLHNCELHDRMPPSSPVTSGVKDRNVESLTEREVHSPELYLQHERDCPQHPSFTLSYHSFQDTKPHLSYKDNLHTKHKKGSPRRVAKRAWRQGKNKKFAKRFLTLSAEAIGWRDDASLDSDSTSQTSRKAHDSDDLDKSTSSSDDDTDGYPLSGWPQGVPDSDKAATWPRVRGKGQLTRNKPGCRELPKQTVPVSDFVRMWLDTGCPDPDSEVTDPEFGDAKGTGQSDTKREMKNRTKGKDRLNPLLHAATGNVVNTSSGCIPKGSNEPRDLDFTRVNQNHQRHDVELYELSQHHRPAKSKKKSAQHSESTKCINPLANASAGTDVCMHKRVEEPNRPVGDPDVTTECTSKGATDTPGAHREPSAPKSKRIANPAVIYPSAELFTDSPTHYDQSGYQNNTLVLVSEYRRMDDCGQALGQKHPIDVLHDKLKIDSVSLDVHESLV